MQNKVVRLLEEKRDALKQLAELKLAQLRAGAGNVSGEDVVKANLALLEVQLELASSRTERIAVLEKMAKEAQFFEDKAKSDQVAGIASGADILEARLKILEYRLRLEREKAVLTK